MSLVGLLLTFLVYIILPDFKNLHGKIVLSNVISIALTTIYFIIVFNTDTSSWLCAPIGYMGYFSSLSMFFWMTIMCLDLCLTFSRTQVSNNSSETFQFFIYSLISWGLPSSLTLILLMFHFLIPKDSSLYPGVGEDKCFLNGDNYSEIVFFFIPMMALMILNCLIYFTMIGKLVIAKRETRNARISSTRGDQGSSSEYKEQLVKSNISKIKIVFQKSNFTL